MLSVNGIEPAQTKWALPVLFASEKDGPLQILYKLSQNTLLFQSKNHTSYNGWINALTRWETQKVPQEWTLVETIGK